MTGDIVNYTNLSYLQTLHIILDVAASLAAPNVAVGEDSPFMSVGVDSRTSIRFHAEVVQRLSRRHLI